MRRSLVEGGRIEFPKNGKIRRVDLSLILADTLRELRARRREEALSRGWPAVLEWVFVTEVGLPIWKSDFERRVFHKALEKADLRRIRFHDLQHTFASRLLQNRGSVVYVKDQLGHHSIKVTVDAMATWCGGRTRRPWTDWTSRRRGRSRRRRAAANRRWFSRRGRGLTAT